MNKLTLAIGIIAVVIIGFYFFGSDSQIDQNSIENSNQEEVVQNAQDSKEDSAEQSPPPKSSDWRDIELTDVLTGETYTISELNDKPILLEAFAVWCPTCKRQQDKIKELHQEIGDDAISIALDVDPNEDENQVIDHVFRHGFDWRFSISPQEVTDGLREEFGLSFLSPPFAPMALLCPDGTSKFLSSGVKSVQKLKEELATC